MGERRTENGEHESSWKGVLMFGGAGYFVGTIIDMALFYEKEVLFEPFAYIFAILGLAVYYFSLNSGEDAEEDEAEEFESEMDDITF